MPDPARALRLRVGSAIRRLRLERRVSQERLAELASTAAKHVGAIERGEANAGLNLLARLAAALSVDPEDFFVQFRGRRRRGSVHVIASDDVDALMAIVRRVKAVRVRRTPRAND